MIYPTKNLKDVGCNGAGEVEEKPKLKLVGEDGNAYTVLGRALKVARNAEWSQEKIKEFQQKAMSGDYDNLLRVCMDYFDVLRVRRVRRIVRKPMSVQKL
jgi:hypothetical protein